ncbi:hypothetical protein EMGBS6_18450, partial [Opitutia bacterium]
GRRDLLPDEAGFTDAAQDDLAGVSGDEIDGVREGAIEAGGEFTEGRASACNKARAEWRGVVMEVSDG